MEGILKQKDIGGDFSAQEIKIRTMESDLKAIQASGGEISGVQVQDFSKKDSGVAGAEEPIFVPKSHSALNLEESPVANENNSSNKKIIWLVLGAFAIGAAFGLLGYFVVFPLFSK